LGIFIEIYFFCVSKLWIDLFFKLPVNRYLAINIEGKIGELTVIRTSSFITQVRAWEPNIQRQYHNIIQPHKLLGSYKNAVASVSYNYIFISYFFHNSVWVWSTITVFVHVTKSWEGKDCKRVKECFCLLLLIYFHCM
jgi:hypothetical protein